MVGKQGGCGSPPLITPVLLALLCITGVWCSQHGALANMYSKVIQNVATKTVAATPCLPTQLHHHVYPVQ
jgi:hypothetical protein